MLAQENVMIPASSPKSSENAVKDARIFFTSALIAAIPTLLVLWATAAFIG